MEVAIRLAHTCQSLYSRDGSLLWNSTIARSMSSPLINSTYRQGTTNQLTDLRQTTWNNKPHLTYSPDTYLDCCFTGDGCWPWSLGQQAHFSNNVSRGQKVNQIGLDLQSWSTGRFAFIYDWLSWLCGWFQLSNTHYWLWKGYPITHC